MMMFYKTSFVCFFKEAIRNYESFYANCKSEICLPSFSYSKAPFRTTRKFVRFSKNMINQLIC